MQPQGYLTKQASSMLEKPMLAWVMTGIFALFPLTSWVSLAIMALVVLRLDWFDGIRCLIVGLTVSICFAEMAGQLSDALTTTLPTYLLCYGGAYLLRKSASWQLVAMVSFTVAILAIVGVHYFAVNFLIEQYKSLLEIISAIDQDNLLVPLMGSQSVASQLKFAHYLFGIKVLSVLLSVMLPLMLARSVQSSLYYPGGFKREMINFRANSLGVALLILTALGAYEHNLLAISCLPIFFVYLMLAGISLILNLLAQKKKIVVYGTLLLPMIILPYVVLPVYVLFGAVDSVFNLRLKNIFRR